MDGFEDRFVNVRGIKTRYWQAGSNGSAVILLQGWLFRARWQENVVHLPRAIVCMLWICSAMD